VPDILCDLDLISVELDQNPNITCFPECLMNALSGSFAGVDWCGPTGQDEALCSLIAATNVAAFLGDDTQWSCTAEGVAVTHPCSAPWTGVVCVNNYQIVSLNLLNSFSQGTLPSALGSITALSFLDLGSNCLSGTIPGELGSLSMLQTLSLFDNLLNGSIPLSLADSVVLANFSAQQNSLTGKDDLC
jgi:hypothetical protein